MKKLLTLSAVAIALASCQKKDMALNFTVKDMKTDSIGIYLADMDTMIAVDNQGKASLKLPLKTPEYGVLQYKFKRSTVYLEPGKPLNVTWDMTPSALTIGFEGGNADKNNYLNGKELKGPLMGDFGKTEDDLLRQLEDYLAEDYGILDGKKFDKAFTSKERQRIEYWVYGMLSQYANGKSCSPATYEKLESLVKEEPWLMQLREYTNYVTGVIMVIANRNEKSTDGAVRMENAVKYAVSHIKGQKLKDYLLGTYGLAYIENFGVNKAATVKSLIEQNVKDGEVLSAFKAAYDKGKSFAKGTPSPSFTMTDINGKTYTLADLKGHVVYIDVWATWCAPCQGELPHLKALQDMFQGTNIVFVSMSIDKDKAAWEKQVKDEKLGGIQLYAGPKSDFCEAYKITGIPRFILIDKEGNIVEANMTRPSDPKTIETLGTMAEGKE